MALDSFVKSDLEGTITLTDGAAVTMSLMFDNGDLSVGPLAETLNEALSYERRGRFKSAGSLVPVWHFYSDGPPVHGCDS